MEINWNCRTTNATEHVAIIIALTMSCTRRVRYWKFVRYNYFTAYPTATDWLIISTDATFGPRTYVWSLSWSRSVADYFVSNGFFVNREFFWSRNYTDIEFSRRIVYVVLRNLSIFFTRVGNTRKEKTGTRLRTTVVLRTRGDRPSYCWPNRSWSIMKNGDISTRCYRDWNVRRNLIFRSTTFSARSRYLRPFTFYRWATFTDDGLVI